MNRDAALFEFRFPDIGEGLTEGTIVEVKVAAGQHVKPGDALAIVETDKVVTDMPSPVDGVVAEISLVKGQVVRVGEIIARIKTDAAPRPTAVSAHLEPAGTYAEEGTVVGKLDTSSGGVLPASTEASSPRKAQALSAPAPVARNPVPGGTPDGNGTAGAVHRTAVRASPVARKLAADAGIDLSRVNGTGPGGRILKKDLARPAEVPSRPQAGAAGAADASGGEVRKLSTLRLAIATAMEKSQAIPAAAVHDYTLVDELLQLRRDMNAASTEKTGLLAFFVKATAMALKDYPLLSSTYSPERRDYQTYTAPAIGVAVDTEEGLVVPVVKNAAELSVTRIHAEIVRLTEKARARTLLLEEIRGGSFTISNFGSFSGVYGNPMILPPQVGILGIGRVHQEPVVKSGQVVPASVLPLSLVVDHRLIDGVYACKFLSRFMELVSKPLLLLMP
jgi:pyruvate dehydrogenase E2 component (dihydrolipoamide acetyltransferase)